MEQREKAELRDRGHVHESVSKMHRGVSAHSPQGDVAFVVCFSWPLVAWNKLYSRHKELITVHLWLGLPLLRSVGFFKKYLWQWFTS